MVCKTFVALFIAILFCGIEASSATFELQFVSRIASPLQTFDNDTAEIPAFDKNTQTVYLANSGRHGIDYFNITFVTSPVYGGFIDLFSYGDLCASVAIHKSVLATVISAWNSTANGLILLFDASNVPPTLITSLTVGALPDSVLFTPDGKKILVANEGEPNEFYTVDPEGSVSVVQLFNDDNDVEFTVSNLKKYTPKVTTLDFRGFNNKISDYQDPESSIRIYGLGATVAQDLEPEYFAISDNSKDAWVILQDNNAFAHIDLDDLEITSIRGFGYKDASKSGNGFDANGDDGINIKNWPVSLMYQPDECVFMEIDGTPYLIVANEGDKRDYFADEVGFNEVSTVDELVLDPTVFANATTLQGELELGPLKVSNIANYADVDNDGDVDVLYSFGARSFGLWNLDKNRFDFESGDDIEQFLATSATADFNSKDNENQSFDGRSTTAGPEPEGVEKGNIDGIDYIFVSLDKQGGILMYEIEDPKKPIFKAYVNHRDFSVVFDETNFQNALDLGPEGLVFIPFDENNDRNDLIVLSNTISGNLSIFRVVKNGRTFNSDSNNNSSNDNNSSDNNNSSNDDSSSANLLVPSLIFVVLSFTAMFFSL